MAKETVYIEADDEITAVIDKVLSTKDAIVAVVLPKRATVFQSVVNMKLLKKAAEESKKRVVLISSEPSISAIAAVAGMHLAQSLSSKPAIPKKTKLAGPETITPKEFEGANKRAGEPELRPETSTESVVANPPESDTIELDNTEEEAEELPAGTLAKASGPVKKKKRIFKIPDFSSFRLRMGLGIAAAVLLILGWILGFVVLPKATITINTDTAAQPITFDFTARTDATELDTTAGVLPAKKVEVTKEDKATAPATGEKNVGEKAGGTITLTNCRTGASGVNVPAGTGFSTGGLTFITTESVELGPAVIIGTCKSADFPAFGAVKDVGALAAQPGEEYNIPEGSLKSSINGVSAHISAVSGGTSKVIKVVSKEDVQKAKDQLAGSATADALEELKTKLAQQQVQALIETLVQTEPVLKNSPAIDAEASEVVVTQTASYSMLGVASSDLGLVVDARIQDTLKDSTDKNVRNNGLGTATYQLAASTSADNQTITVQVIAVLGPVFDESAIKRDAAGKKRGDIEKTLETLEGVRSASVEYSPFWITTTPKSVAKIEIIINELEN